MMASIEELEGVLTRLKESNIPDKECNTEKFPIVFRRLAQEHVADRIFSNASYASTYDEAIDIALKTAETWFGPYQENNWPVDRHWLIDYIKGRYHGSRSGIYIEDKPGNEKTQFIENNPKNSAICEWELGCSQPENLQVDHITPTSLHGKHSLENYQYLCKNHNQRWKGNLLFWDVDVPMPGTRD